MWETQAEPRGPWTGSGLPILPQADGFSFGTCIYPNKLWRFPGRDNSMITFMSSEVLRNSPRGKIMHWDPERFLHQKVLIFVALVFCFCFRFPFPIADTLASSQFDSHSASKEERKIWLKDKTSSKWIKTRKHRCGLVSFWSNLITAFKANIFHDVFMSYLK